MSCFLYFHCVHMLFFCFSVQFKISFNLYYFFIISIKARHPTGNDSKMSCCLDFHWTLSTFQDQRTSRTYLWSTSRPEGMWERRDFERKNSELRCVILSLNGLPFSGTKYTGVSWPGEWIPEIMSWLRVLDILSNFGFRLNNSSEKYISLQK